MKNYYRILGIPDNATQQEIKRAFRKLAFQYHPDTNPGNEKQSEERFKEINEAYGILGDEDKRLQYDFARKGRFAGAGYGTSAHGFQYSQQDIFRNTFSNQATFDELNRMFGQAGLRFDQDFLNQVFFKGSGFIFHFSPGYGGASQRYPNSGVSTYQPSFQERLLSKIMVKVGKFILRTLSGRQYEPLPKQNLDQHIELEISSSEAIAGGEKTVSYQRGEQTKRLMVRIPRGVKTGTKIRLKDMGKIEGSKSGDLYLHLKIN